LAAAPTSKARLPSAAERPPHAALRAAALAGIRRDPRLDLSHINCRTPFAHHQMEHTTARGLEV
jgi:hypothetical protein